MSVFYSERDWTIPLALSGSEPLLYFALQHAIVVSQDLLSEAGSYLKSLGGREAGTTNLARYYSTGFAASVSVSHGYIIFVIVRFDSF